MSERLFTQWVRLQLAAIEANNAHAAAERERYAIEGDVAAWLKEHGPQTIGHYVYSSANGKNITERCRGRG